MNNNQQQLLMQMLLNNFNNNPLYLRAQKMAEGKTPEELQQIAMNLCKERGLDFETMLYQFQSSINRF